MLEICAIMNNYFHDVATAPLFGAVVVVWAFAKRPIETAGEQLG